MREGLTILELNQRLSEVISRADGLQNIWVIGETSDLRVAGGHCYMELVQKGEDGSNLSRIRANIWSSTWKNINSRFIKETGGPLVSGLTIRACVRTSYHPTYGMSVNITDVDTAYTLGDAARRRNEIINRLIAEGLTELNRSLKLPFAPQRVAVISARGAAGFGDFVNHLLSTPARLRFEVTLFPAVMQGNETVPTVLNALDSIRREAGRFDVVVIIRGGGATTDLAAFDNYELARAVATMPVPVIVGIGHERDTTVLDYVGHRVKTPTAAAEMLIARVTSLIDGLGRFAEQMYRAAAVQIAANREYLARASSAIPGVVSTAMTRESSRLERMGLSLTMLSDTAIAPRIENLKRIAADLGLATANRLKFAAGTLGYYEEMIRVLSPDAVLARGFSITTGPDGRAITDVSSVEPGTILVTRLRDGELTSQTISKNKY
ncbi:MAG: exodeoxyribonuclease VII large subunit [Muribaculaceae bacterium]|nr:exodeoxyribonuclease VII large subunit [Muribaculaceae bacterium]